MDANSDGYVTQDELKYWVLKSFRNLAEEEGESTCQIKSHHLIPFVCLGLDRFEEEDLNEDGWVTWAEHLKDNFDIDNEFTEVVSDPENQQMIAEGEIHRKLNLAITAYVQIVSCGRQPTLTVTSRCRRKSSPRSTPLKSTNICTTQSTT